LSFVITLHPLTPRLLSARSLYYYRVILSTMLFMIFKTDRFKYWIKVWIIQFLRDAYDLDRCIFFTKTVRIWRSFTLFVYFWLACADDFASFLPSLLSRTVVLHFKWTIKYKIYQIVLEEKWLKTVSKFNIFLIMGEIAILDDEYKYVIHFY